MLSVPLRFFLTAPFFALAAATVLAWTGPDAFASRWTPTLLAATHLVTLGFLTMVMIGALLQVLPVVAGAAVPAPSLVAAAVHVPLSGGTLLLAAGLATGAPALLKFALPLLAGAFGILLWAAAHALWRAPVDSAAVTAMRLAVAALLATVLLGLILAVALARGWMLPLITLTDLHLQWGLIGWVGLLVSGVATQVMPMFQATSPFSQNGIRWLVRFVFFVLMVSTILGLVAPADTTLRFATEACLALSAAAFAAYTLYRLQGRRRRFRDATTTLWVSGTLCALGAVLLWGGAQIWQPVRDSRAYAPLLGMLIIPGFGVSVINGMLYKIVPLLTWLAMQNEVRGRAAPPNVKIILPAGPTQWQAQMHLLALVMLFSAAIWPQFVFYPALAAYALSSAFLWKNLVYSCGVHRRFVRTLRDTP